MNISGSAKSENGESRILEFGRLGKFFCRLQFIPSIIINY